MTFITYRNRVEKQMLLYIDFLPFCETQAQKLKLIDEIVKLKAQIARVDKFTMEMAVQTIWRQSRTRKSKIIK